VKTAVLGATLGWVYLPFLLTGSRGFLGLPAVVGLAMFSTHCIVAVQAAEIRLRDLPAWGLLACAAYLVPQSSWLRIFPIGIGVVRGHFDAPDGPLGGRPGRFSEPPRFLGVGFRRVRVHDSKGSGLFL